MATMTVVGWCIRYSLATWGSIQVFSSFFQFCDVAESGDHPLDDLARFGYRLDMKEY
jgi:hypothetical protein